MNINVKKQIIVTGGAGFIGINLIKKLIKFRYFPIIIDNLSNSNISQLKKISSKYYFLIRSDINDLNKIYKKIEGFNPQTIIHLAALHYIPFCNKNPEITKKVNVNGTRIILKLAQKIGIKNMIFASSGAVYKNGYKSHKENENLRPLDVYGKSKKMAENFLLKNCKKFNINLIILRFFNIYGNFDLTPHFIPEIIKRIKGSKYVKVGNLNTKRDYLHVDDLTDLFIKILRINKKYIGIYNVGTGHTYSGYDVIRLISSIYNKPIQIIEIEELKRKNDIPVLCANIKKTSNRFHWKPKTILIEGLKKMIYDKKQ